MQHHNYSLSDLEDMIPWEREIYLTMLKNHIDEKNEETREYNERMKNRSG
jgi:hypothetical protein